MNKAEETIEDKYFSFCFISIFPSSSKHEPNCCQNQTSINPVILRIEFLTHLKSRPFNVLPFPVQTENAIFPATLLAKITCGGTISSSSSSPEFHRRIIPSGIFTGTDLATFFFFFFSASSFPAREFSFCGSSSSKV